VFLKMTVWANQFKIIQIVILTVSIAVMYLEYLIYRIPASFTYTSAFFRQTCFKASLPHDSISRTSEFIPNACTVSIGTASAAGLFMCTCKNQFSADYARVFFSAGDAVAFLGAKCIAGTSF
jgi:hypothetical protein